MSPFLGWFVLLDCLDGQQVQDEISLHDSKNWFVLGNRAAIRQSEWHLRVVQSGYQFTLESISEKAESTWPDSKIELRHLQSILSRSRYESSWHIKHIAENWTSKLWVRTPLCTTLKICSAFLFASSSAWDDLEFWSARFSNSSGMAEEEAIFLPKLSGDEHSESSEIVLNNKLRFIWIGDQSPVSANSIITWCDGESNLENCIENICRYRMIPMKYFAFAPRHVSEIFIYIREIAPSMFAIKEINICNIWYV